MSSRYMKQLSEQFLCPNCGKPIGKKKDLQGQRWIKCPHCEEDVLNDSISLDKTTSFAATQFISKFKCPWCDHIFAWNIRQDGNTLNCPKCARELILDQSLRVSSGKSKQAALDAELKRLQSLRIDTDVSPNQYRVATSNLPAKGNPTFTWVFVVIILGIIVGFCFFIPSCNRRKNGHSAVSSSATTTSVSSPVSHELRQSSMS